MRKLLVAATLVTCGFLSPPSSAQTLPPNGWFDHVDACFGYNQVFRSSGLNSISTPAVAQRTSLTFSTLESSGKPSTRNLRVALWRQECANNPRFPILMMRFEEIRSPTTPQDRSGTPLRSVDIELIQDGKVTNAESFGSCSLDICRKDEDYIFEFDPSFSERGTIIVAQARDPNVLLRNAFQFRFRGTTQVVNFGGTIAGGEDMPMAGTLNGTYFDPARSGEGIMVDFFAMGTNQKGIFVSWYTYDDSGRGLWLVGNASLSPGATSVDVPMIVTEGGQFGPLFQASRVRRSAWGSINLRFPSCGSAVMRYTRAADGQSGQYRMSRLGQASDVRC